MNPLRVTVEAVLVGCLVVTGGFFGIWRQFSDRIPPHTYIGTFPLGGIRVKDVAGALASYDREFQQSRIVVHVRGKDVRHTLQELGVRLNYEQTTSNVLPTVGQFISWRRTTVRPVAIFADEVARKVLEQDFASVVTLPKQPTLTVAPDYSVTIIPGSSGEGIDMISLDRDMEHAFAITPYPRVLASIVRATPTQNIASLEVVRAYASQLLSQGMVLTYGEQAHTIARPELATMLQFTSFPHEGVGLNTEKLTAYLTSTVAPEVYKEPVNARFQIEDGKVSQFALPQKGEELNLEKSATAIQQSVASHSFTASLAVDTSEPALTDVQSIETLGITQLLAKGETDFKGSPKNRVHNIETGTARYHGILIAPGEEFSFLKYLGPVDASTGFKPELVIKNNVTTPEFGGGLCQVSTTLFRAAVYAGMDITMRRNHSYAVRYYGTPGFDATIYPPYTDFRFLNNTPGTILIQTKIEDTRLSFELWGTNDGQMVEVDGPHPYAKQANGAVKAKLTQKVVRDGSVIIEDTFTSNYKSPSLFPKIVKANGEM
jgi:vancomycin resistance protein YoaR